MVKESIAVESKRVQSIRLVAQKPLLTINTNVGFAHNPEQGYEWRKSAATAAVGRARFAETAVMQRHCKATMQPSLSHLSDQAD